MKCNYSNRLLAAIIIDLHWIGRIPPFPVALDLRTIQQSAELGHCILSSFGGLSKSAPCYAIIKLEWRINLMKRLSIRAKSLAIWYKPQFGCSRCSLCWRGFWFGFWFLWIHFWFHFISYKLNPFKIIAKLIKKTASSAKHMKLNWCYTNKPLTHVIAFVVQPHSEQVVHTFQSVFSVYQHWMWLKLWFNP